MHASHNILHFRYGQNRSVRFSPATLLDKRCLLLRPNQTIPSSTQVKRFATFGTSLTHSLTHLNNEREREKGEKAIGMPVLAHQDVIPNQIILDADNECHAYPRVSVIPFIHFSFVCLFVNDGSHCVIETPTIFLVQVNVRTVMVNFCNGP